MTISENHILQHILTLSKKLIAIPSITYDIEASHKVLNLAKKELEGYFPFEEFEKNKVPSVLFHNTNRRTKHFKVILNAHLDVVPGKTEQYHPIEKNGKLYGRGAYDMKAATVAMILAFKNIANEISYPLALQIVTDEEPGSPYGTQYQVGKGIRGDFILTGEAGSNFNIKNEAKGILHIKLTTKGTESHSGYPWLGDNAILKMQQIVNTLTNKYPLPTEATWKTMATVTNIKTSNTVFNKVPSDCTIDVDIRYVKEEQEHILETIRQLLPSDVTIEVIQRAPAAHTDESNQYLGLLKKSARHQLKREITTANAYASSDVRIYNLVGCDGVEFGPIGAHHHSDNEWVDIQSLEDYYHILKNFLLSVK